MTAHPPGRIITDRTPPGRVAYVNARLLDPATGLDATGAVLTDGEIILDVGPGLFTGGVPAAVTVVDCKGACLAPGLVDMRVQLREPGEEHKETLSSGGQAAVAGGVTSMVCLPNTHPVIDDVATVEFVARRARQIGLAKVYPYAAATRGLAGKELAEIGMLKEAGALAFTDGVRAIRDAQTMRRVLAYAATFDALVVQHPEEPSLAENGMMNEGETATRLGLAGIPAAAEAMLIERDMRLVELTGARYHAAHVSTAAGAQVISSSQGPRTAGYSRYRAALLCAERNGRGRLADLRQTVPASAPRGGSPRRRGRDRRWHHRRDRLGSCPAGSGLETSAFRSGGLRRRRGWKLYCRSPSNSSITAISPCSARSSV